MAETLRIFLSSPGDVAEERILAQRVLDRLGREFGNRARIEPIIWEHEPLLASDNFQVQIPSPAEADVVVCILWSRIGTRLPDTIQRPDGSTYQSGTEYEFEVSLESFRARGKPSLLIYRKVAEPVASLSDRAAVLELLDQKDALDSFIQRWMHDTDGSLRAAYHSFESSDRFAELLEHHLKRLIERLPAPQGPAEATAPRAWVHGSPFRGLHAFDFEHAPVFFGRSRSIVSVLDALRRQAANGRAFVLVVGMSGSGKSSLLRAGVLPLMTEAGVVEGVGTWRHAVFSPAATAGDLFDGLSRALVAARSLLELAEESEGSEGIARVLREGPDAAVALITRALDARGEGDRPPARLALLIDQLEAIFDDRRFDPSQRTAFVSVVDALARSGRVWVLSALRSDYYPRCAELPELLELKAGPGQVDLAPPSNAEIGEIVRLPAASAGLRFEVDTETGERLDDVLRDAATDRPESLPLLEFTLEQLYERRSEDDVLTLSAYREMGGVEGALARHAEETFESLTPEGKAALSAVFRQLVAVSGSDDEAATGRAAVLDTVDREPGARSFVEAFVESRLLVIDGGSGAATVRIAHDSLLRSWPRAREWLERDRELLHMRDRVAVAAARWRKDERNPDLLLPTGKPLIEGRELLDSSLSLPSEVSEFVSASEAQDRRRTRRRRLAIVGLVALTVATGVMSVVAVWQGQLAVARETEARSSLASLYYDHARRRLLAGAPGPALLYSIAALENGGDGTALRFIARRAAAQVETQRLRIPLGEQRGSLEAREVILSPDGTRVLVSDASTGGLWDAETGEELAVLDAGNAEFSPDGRSMIAGDQEGRVRLFDAATGSQVKVVGRHEGGVTATTFCPDGRRAVSSGADGIVRVWHLETGEQVQEIPSTPSPSVHCTKDQILSLPGSFAADRSIVVWDLESGSQLFENPVADNHSLTLAPDGRSFVTFGTGPARVWALSSGRLITVLRHASVGSAAWVNSAAYSPDSKRVVTASADRSARVWDAASGAVLLDLHAHSARVSRARFSPDGFNVVTASEDRTAIVWEIDTGNRLFTLDAHTAPVRDALFTPDGGGLVTISGPELVLWDAPPGLQGLALWGNEERVPFVSYSADGRHIVTASNGNDTARVWEAATGKLSRTLEHGGKVVSAIAIRPDGRHVLTGSGAGARIWDLESGALVRVMPENELWSLAYNPDGSAFATIDTKGLVRIRGAGDGALRASIQSRVTVGSGDGLLFDPDSQLLVAAAPLVGGHASIIDAETGHLVRTLELPGPSGLSLGARGRLAASPSVDIGDLVIYSLEDGRAERRLPTFGSTIKFDTAGRLLAVGKNTGSIEIWDTNSGELNGEFQAHDRPVGDFAFDPTGELLLTGGRDGRALVWDVKGNALLGSLAEGIGEVFAVTFSPDGTRAIAAPRHGSARIFETDLEERGFEALRAIADRLLPFDLEGEHAITSPVVGERPNKGRDDSERRILQDNFVKIISFDDRGNQVEERFEDFDGQPVRHEDGYQGWRAEYDDRGLMQRFENFGYDPEGGFDRRIDIFDDAGRVLQRRFAKGQASNAWFFTYDESGRLVERRLEISDLKFCDMERYAREPLGNFTEWVCLREDGEARSDASGVARIVQRFDERGNRVERSSYGEDGEPRALESGVARVEFRYDEHGRLLEEVSYGTDGQQAENSTKIARNTYTYDPRGMQTSVARFDANGRPTRGTMKEAGWRRAYDEDGRVREQRRYGLDPTQGYARERHRYDDFGNVIEEAFLNHAGELVDNLQGQARIVQTWNARGKLASKSYFDSSGHPARVGKGHTGWSARYDESGRQIEREYFGYAENERRRRYRYDGRGNQVALSYLDSGSNLITRSDGYAQVVWRYDGMNRMLEERYLDEKGSLVRRTAGFSRSTFAYADDGRKVSAILSGYDGRKGYVAARRLFDDDGHISEQWYLGSDGRLAQHRDGNFGLRNHRDDAGRLVELIFLDRNGRAASVSEGYARKTFRYDNRGNATEIAHFDSEGLPVETADGYQVERRAYSEAGKLVAQTYLDAEGKRANLGVVIVEIIPGSQAEAVGLAPGDVVYLYGGHVLRTPDHLISLTSTTGSKLRTIWIRRGGAVFDVEIQSGRIGIRVERFMNDESAERSD